jgi:hypothetical protein
MASTRSLPNKAGKVPFTPSSPEPSHSANSPKGSLGPFGPVISNWAFCPDSPDWADRMSQSSSATMAFNSGDGLHGMTGSARARSSSRIPCPSVATVSTTGMPKSFCSNSVSTSIPRLRDSSAMLRSRTVGKPSSTSWLMRRRVRRRFLESATTRTMSGRSCKRMSRVTRSSSE